RLTLEPKVRTRLAEAVEQALNLADGSVIVSVERSESETEDILLSAHYACLHCDRSYEPPSPQLFSFNNPQGMCPECDGLGSQYTFDPALLIPDPARSFYEGAIPIVGPLRGMGRWRKHIYEGIAKQFDIDVNMPWQDMPPDHQRVLMFGAGDQHIT